MTDMLLKTYHALPPPLRSMAASLRGFYLRFWRYGSETERLAEEAIDRESWSLTQWKVWQEERLAYVLNRAATQVPYYREQWATRRRKGDRASWEYLENWPILEKEPVRQNPSTFVADDCDKRLMFHDHTSGSTSKPLNLWLRRETVRKWYALCEARILGWNGVSRHDRWGMIGGQLVTPVDQRQPPFWIWNHGLKQLYMSSYHLAPDLISFYLEAMSRYRVSYLLGYTSSLYTLARAVLESGRQRVNMAVAITNAEPVFEHQRSTIAQAFNCPVRETYGMAETVVCATECTAGKLHLWPEAGLVEVVGENRSLPDGTAGDLICTGLLNIDMPLIRYRTGDRGALACGHEPCRCGRNLPVIESVDGRIDDLVYTMDGRRIGRITPIFSGDLPIREAQIIQEALDRVKIRYVPAPGFNPDHECVIRQRLQDRMGAVEVIMEPVDVIARGPNGKFRGVINELSKDVRNALSV